MRDILDTANAVGIEDQPVRLAVRRLIGAGEVVQAGRGRRGEISLTAAGRQRLAADRLALRLAVAQDDGRMPWDGRWRLISVTVPESRRALRDGLRRTLRELGAAPLSTSLYLSAHDLGGLIEPDLHEHLVQAVAIELRVHGATDHGEIAETLWPAEPVLAGYEAMGEVLRWAQRSPLGNDRDALVVQLYLAEVLERAMRHDPLLPPELRQGEWAPVRSRRVWRRCWHRASAVLPREVLYRGWLAD